MGPEVKQGHLQGHCLECYSKITGSLIADINPLSKEKH